MTTDIQVKLRSQHDIQSPGKQSAASLLENPRKVRLKANHPLTADPTAAIRKSPASSMPVLTLSYMSRDESKEPDPLKYSGIWKNILFNLFFGLILTLIFVAIHVVVAAFSDVNQTMSKSVSEGFWVPVKAWSSIICNQGFWWFGTALATVAFLTPSALAAADRAGPLSPLYLRIQFASVASIVAGATSLLLILVFIGADYSQETTYVTLFLLGTSGFVILFVAGLVQSLQGYDHLRSLERALEKNQNDLKGFSLHSTENEGMALPTGRAQVPIARALMTLICVWCVPLIVLTFLLLSAQKPWAGVIALLIVLILWTPVLSWMMSRRIPKIPKLIAVLFVAALVGFYGCLFLLSSLQVSEDCIWAVFFLLAGLIAGGVLSYCRWITSRQKHGVITRCLPSAALLQLAYTALLRRIQNLEDAIEIEQKRRALLERAS